jgi:protein phosphatase
VEAGDYFFLCSDGVLHCIDDEELYKLFSSSISDEEKYKTLANKCVRSSDNNTAVFVPVVDVTCSEDSNESQDSSMGSATEMIDIHSKSESQIVEISPSADESPLKRIANFVKNLF